MEEKDFLDCINFFNDLSVDIEDITPPEDKINKEVVRATYYYNDKTYTTKPLYYNEISDLDTVKDIDGLHQYFGSTVFWLDIEKHQWPKDSGENDLNQVIDDITDNNEFKEFLHLLANNNKDGYIQRITQDGRSAQYSHNLENNNHWHDLIFWIKETIKQKGENIDKSFFKPLVFNWNGDENDKKRTSLDRRAQNKDPYGIVICLNENIKKNSSKMDITKIKKILCYKKQLILQGPPGTGKTRLAKELAVAMLDLNGVKQLKENEQFKLIQFHPSYTYEDFVRGIVAKSDEEGDGLVYETENKTLGKFAAKALNNYNLSKNLNKKDESFKIKINSLIEEISEKIDESSEYTISNLSKAKIIAIKENGLLYYFPKRKDIKYTLLFSDIEKVYNIRNKIKKATDLRDRQDDINLIMKGKYSYYYMIIQKLNDIKIEPNKNKSPTTTIERPYILVIDEINRANLSSVLGELIYALEYRGEEVESMYAIEGNNKLILPPNLYIIGTMNTADRSVGHIDYAIRRRFAFIDVLPEELSDNDEIYFNKDIFKKVSALFNTTNVSSEFKIENVQIGHSYFIADKKEATSESKRDEIFKMKMNYEVIPILIEYVKDGVLIGNFQEQEIGKYINSLKIE